MQAISSSAAEEEGRYSPRKRLFLSGVISFGEVTAPVRIRDLSTSGAQLEGDSLPDVGTSIRIDRGTLCVSGTIVWRAKNGAGLHFDEPLALDTWLLKPSAHDQLIVDAQLEQARSGGALPIALRPAPRPPKLARETLPARLAEELAYVSRMIEQLGNVLASDAPVVVRYAEELQTLDLSTQILGHVAALIVAEDPDKVVATIGIESLRKRLLRGPL